MRELPTQAQFVTEGDEVMLGNRFLEVAQVMWMVSHFGDPAKLVGIRFDEAWHLWNPEDLLTARIWG